MLYGWAKNAEAMHLPPGVGFRIGQGTGTRHLVLQARVASSRMLIDRIQIAQAAEHYRWSSGTASNVLIDEQVHYTLKRPPGDKSGMRLKLTDAPLPFSAGMMMYASYFQIPPKKSSHLVPTKCCYAGFEPAYGFAYRVHTHALGR